MNRSRDETEEGEVLSPSPSADEGYHHHHGALSAPRGRGGGRGRGDIFRGGGRMMGGRGGRGRYTTSRGSGGRSFPPAPRRFSNSNNNEDDATSQTSGGDDGSHSYRGRGRGGRGGRYDSTSINYPSDRGGRGGRGGGRGRGRSYMTARTGAGRGRYDNNWNNNDAGSVSSFEANINYRGRGRGRSSYGRGGGRGGRGGRYNNNDSSFSYGKRRREDDGSVDNINSNDQPMKRVRDTAMSFGSEGEIFPEDEFMDDDNNDNNTNNAHYTPQQSERRMSNAGEQQPRRTNGTDHPGLDRPLSEGRRGGESWEDRSVSQEGRHSTSPQDYRKSPVGGDTRGRNDWKSGSVSPARQHSPSPRFTSHQESSILPPRDNMDNHHAERYGDDSSLNRNSFGGPLGRDSSLRRDSLRFDSQKRNVDDYPADPRDSFRSDSQTRKDEYPPDRRDPSRSDSLSNRRDDYHRNHGDSQSRSTDYSPFGNNNQQELEQRESSFRSMGPPRNTMPLHQQQDSSYGEPAEMDSKMSSSEERRFESKDYQAEQENKTSERQGTGVSPSDTGGIFRRQSNERNFPNQGDSERNFSNQHPGSRDQSSQRDDRYSNQGRSDYSSMGGRNKPTNNARDVGGTSPHDGNRRGPPPSSFRREGPPDDRRKLAPNMPQDRRDFRPSPPNRFTSNTQAVSQPPVDNKVLQTGYAALANLPGPLGSPRASSQPPQQRPPPPPAVATMPPSDMTRASSPPPPGQQFGGSSNAGGDPIVNQDSAPTRSADLRIDVGRNPSLSGKVPEPSPRGGGKEEEMGSFSNTRPPHSPSPRADDVGMHTNRPHSPSHRSSEFVRRGGFDGPRSQNWVGRGRGGRGRNSFGRGDFSPMGGRGGPRQFDPTIQGRGGRGRGRGDVGGLPGRGGRGPPIMDFASMADVPSGPGLRPIDIPGMMTAGRGGRGPGTIENLALPDNRPVPNIVMENAMPEAQRGPTPMNPMVQDVRRPMDPMMTDDQGMRMGGRPDGGGRAPFDSFRGGRGRAPFGRLGGRGRGGRDFGRGGRGRGWDQSGRMPRPWEQQGPPAQPIPDMSIPPPPPPPPPISSPPPFAMMADAVPDEAFRRRTSTDSGGPKPPPPPPPPMSQISQPPPPPPPPPPVGRSYVDLLSAEKPKPPSPRPASPPPSEPSGLVLALTRLANMEEELNFAYARHMKLMAKQKKLRASYAKLENLPVGLEAIEDDLKEFMAAKEANKGT
eukprot:scaffold2050_cov167-Amphora_coffeaeformis.AAC.5